MSFGKERKPFAAQIQKHALLKKAKPWRGKAAILLVIIAAVIATGCAQTAEPLWDEEGNLIAYTRGELTSGLYIKDGDTYYRPLRYGITFSSPGNGLDTSRYIWMLDGIDRTIPEVGTEQSIILISGSYPSGSVKLQHFADMGTTLGCRFTYSGSDKIMFYGDTCAGTSAAQGRSAMIGNIENVRIQELNNNVFPTELVADGTGLLGGLQQGGYYRIGYYEGTQFEQMTILADARYWVEDAFFELTDFTQTRDGYFVLDLSPQLPAGLYCIDGYGLFYYTAGNTGTYLDESESFDPEGLLPEDDAETEQAPIIDSVGGNNADIPDMPAPSPDNEEVPVTTPDAGRPTLMPGAQIAEPTPGIMMPGSDENNNTDQGSNNMLMPAG